MIQAGQTADARRGELAGGLQQIGRELLGDPPEGAGIAWIPIREGFGFTAGAPSTASLIVRSVPAGFPDDRRELLLTRIHQLWQEVTGCSADEIVVTAFDGPLPL